MNSQSPSPTTLSSATSAHLATRRDVLRTCPLTARDLSRVTVQFEKLGMSSGTWGSGRGVAVVLIEDIEDLEVS